MIETRTDFFTYRAIRSFVVRPVRGGRDQPRAQPARALKPTQRLLTLTTCNPKYSARTRLVVRAVLESSLPKGPGRRPPRSAVAREAG